MPSFRATFVASGLALSFGIPVCAEEAAAPPASSAVRSQAPVLPVIPPRLALPTLQYYNAHPDEFRQFLARLPQRRVAPRPPVPAGAAWQPVTRDGPADALSNPLLLTDGTVIVHQACSEDWYRLTPDSNGSYINGTWSKIASMPAGYAPLYFASQVLNDGRVVVNGGEYNQDCSGGAQGVWTNRGAVYDPATNSWTPVRAPSGWANIGDAQSVVLPNGKYMLANALTKQQALLNPGTMTWAPTGTGKFDVNDEEGWTVLQDGTVLTADGYVFTGTCGRNTERYDPTTGAWTSAGDSPVRLSDCGGSQPSYEVGPQVLRADGSVVSFSGVANGAVAGTAIFRPASRTWSAGPNLPRIGGRNYDLADAPAAWLKNGKILFAASPGLFQTPTHFFEFTTADGVSSIARAPDTPSSPSLPSFVINLLVLPTGQVLQTDTTSTVWIYSYGGTASASLKPVITSVPKALARGHSYKLSGKQLAGITSGGTYGDDVQADTNFPLVRIVNSKTHHVFYAKTSGFSSRGLKPKAASSASFLVPAAGRIETGPSTLSVVANGVQSKAVAVTIN